MKELYFAVGVKHLLFIRYNPDTYKTIDGQKPVGKKKREDTLIKILKNMIDVREFRYLGVLYLYYDWFLIEEMEIEKIKPYK